VLRRYSDFVALQDVLLLRYPYRAIPRLPPKKVIGAEGSDACWSLQYRSCEAAEKCVESCSPHNPKLLADFRDFCQLDLRLSGFYIIISNKSVRFKQLVAVL